MKWEKKHLTIAWKTHIGIKKKNMFTHNTEKRKGLKLLKVINVVWKCNK